MPELRLVLLLLAIFAVMFIVTLALHKFFKSFPKAKYLPAVMLLILAIYNYYLSRLPSTGFEDLANLLLAIMAFVGFVSVVISGIILDRRAYRK